MNLTYSQIIEQINKLNNTNLFQKDFLLTWEKAKMN